MELKNQRHLKSWIVRKSIPLSHTHSLAFPFLFPSLPPSLLLFIDIASLSHMLSPRPHPTVSDNPLSSLPDTFGRCGSLKEVSLERTSLSVLPEDMSGMEKLQILRLANSRLESLPSSLLLRTPVFTVDIDNTPLGEGKKYYNIEGYTQYTERHKAAVDKGIQAGLRVNLT